MPTLTVTPPVPWEKNNRVVRSQEMA